MSVPGPAEWECPACEHVQRLPHSLASADLVTCPLCGNHELYKKKDFPHWIGLMILTVASAVFFLGHYFYHPWVAWAVLIGSALVDGGLYLYVGDAVVCYRCRAHYHGALAGPSHQPFELGVAERYRQERLRREQLLRGQAKP